MTEYQLLDRGDHSTTQVSLKYDDTELFMSVPHDLDVYWRINSVYYQSDLGKDTKF